jgi:SAM-dependent methyltransferase
VTSAIGEAAWPAPPSASTPDGEALSRHDPSVVAYVRDPEIARGYDEFNRWNWLFATDTAFLDEVLPARGRVLDLGCGTGRHLVHLARRGYDVTGVDLSVHMLRRARWKLDREGLDAALFRADIARPGPVEGAPFDACICMFSTLGLIKGKRRRLEALTSWRGLLAEGGVLVCHAHNLWHNLGEAGGRVWLARHLVGSLLPWRELGDKRMANYRGLDELYVHLFRVREMRRLLRRAGFTVERELLLNEERTGPFEGRLAPVRANGFLVAARRR